MSNQSKQNPSITVSNDPLLTPAEFAAGMPFSEGTLNNSRLSGTLMGVAAPKHYRFSRLVRYPASEQQAWLARFELAQTSGEHYYRKRNK